MSVEDRVDNRATAPARDPGAEVRAAFALLTRLPIRDAGLSAEATGAAAFGLVGGLLGLAGAVPLIAVAGTEPVLGSIGAVALVAALSGFFHLDGLADTTDALLVADPARAEAARQDPAIGAGGAAALVLVLGAQVAALASLAAGAGPGLAAAAWLVAATVSRAVPVVAIPLVRAWAGAWDRRRARAGPGGQLAASSTGSGPTRRAGLGSWFADRVGLGDALIAGGTAAVVAVAVAAFVPDGRIATVGGLVGGALGLVVAGAIARARGGLDGDGLGATIELSATAILVVAALGAA
jgi:adenosylcobinamide-GDP ribazoletransferase